MLATSALLAFESAARHGNFTNAARELKVSQPAISRQIARLEQQLSTQLFRRSPEGVTLTEAGGRFWDAVSAGLGLIQDAAVEAVIAPPDEQIVLACSHDVSQLFILPRFRGLQAALGEHIAVRILTYQHKCQQLPRYPAADVIFDWEASVGMDEYVVIHEEAACPVSSPRFAAAHAATLQQPVKLWGDLPFLDLTRLNLGWATWNDWFRVFGHPQPSPNIKAFDSYSYALDAAAEGQGIAMGREHYIEQFLDAGRLVKLSDNYAKLGNRFCGALTAKGKSKLIAHTCLSFLSESM